MDLRASDSPSCARSPTELLAASVTSAARVSDATADAVVRIDPVEDERRARCGLAEVKSLDQLDALMCLPHGRPIPTDDLDPVALSHLRDCPPGCVRWLTGGRSVERQLVPVAAVDLVIVRTARWRSGLRRGATFEPFSARVVLLDRPLRAIADIAWEADAAGVGLWTGGDCGEITEIVAPTPFVRRYTKPAGWRFAEHAYARWISTRRHSGRPDGPENRPVRSTPAASRRPLPGF